MRKKNLYIPLMALLGVIMPGLMVAQPAHYPAPSSGISRLFYIQRTHNTNTIVYELNYSGGELDTDEPVHAYWIRYQEKGQKEELSFIQRKFAYGVKTKLISDKEYELRLVAYDKQKFSLKIGPDGNFHVYATINKKQLILTKIYLEMKKGGSLWSPNIEYAELTGTDPDTKQEIQERIKI